MSLQMLIKKVRTRVIGAQPILMTQEVVYLIRKDQFFKIDSVASQAADQIHRLGKFDVAIIVAVNQEHR